MSVYFHDVPISSKALTSKIVLRQMNSLGQIQNEILLNKVYVNNTLVYAHATEPQEIPLVPGLPTDYNNFREWINTQPESDKFYIYHYTFSLPILSGQILNSYWAKYSGVETSVELDLNRWSLIGALDGKLLYAQLIHVSENSVSVAIRIPSDWPYVYHEFVEFKLVVYNV